MLVLTFFSLLVILGATDSRAPAGFAPIPIGLALTLIHLIGIPVTNLSVNPARSTGPALFVGGWALEQLWLLSRNRHRDSWRLSAPRREFVDGSCPRGQRTRSFTSARNEANENGFSSRKFEVLSKNARAPDVKAPAVRKTIRSA